jgi:hypothetical protein
VNVGVLNPKYIYLYFKITSVIFSFNANSLGNPDNFFDFHDLLNNRMSTGKRNIHMRGGRNIATYIHVVCKYAIGN